MVFSKSKTFNAKAVKKAKRAIFFLFFALSLRHKLKNYVEKAVSSGEATAGRFQVYSMDTDELEN